MFKKIYEWIIQSKKTSLVDSSKTIDYLLNDPTTPELVGSTVYSETRLPVDIKGFAGGGFKISTPEGKAANCYSIINNSLNSLSLKIEKFPLKWAATSKLNVYPIAGQEFNAYYDRNSLKFFYGYDPKVRKNIYAADSNDIVAHELGHAILDCLRPDFWNVQSFEVWALHESFGDIVAILNIMENRNVLELALKQTSGDLSKSNVISRLAEEFGKAIYNITKGSKGYTPFYLRDAVNNYNYVNPETLPNSSPDNVLSKECHSFSRVLTGTWYDCVVEIFNFEVKKNKMNPLEAIVLAKETMAMYFFGAIATVPLTGKIFEALAKKIFIIDSNKGGKYSSVLNKVFLKRKIIKGLSILNTFDLNEINENKKFMRIQSFEEGIIYKDLEKIKIVKISDFIDKKSLINEDFYNIEIEVPFEDRYEISLNGMTMQSLNNLEDNVNMAVSCINSLVSTNKLKDLFIIQNNKLVRDKIIN